MSSERTLQKKTASKTLLPLVVGAVCVWGVLQALLVWIGWSFDVQVLRAGISGAVSVNPLTALLFLLLAVGLWVLRRPNPTPFRLKVGRLAAAGVIVLAVARIADYVFGWQLGWDQWLFQSRLDYDPEFVNRMAPNTAVCMLLLGTALLLFDRRSARVRQVATASAILGALLAWIAIIGYLYSAGHLYGVAHYIPMALPTAVTILFLSLGLLAARPKEEYIRLLTGPEPGSAMARHLLGVAIVVPPLLGGLRIVGERSGLYDMELGAAVFATVYMLVLAAVILRAAARINEADRIRVRTEAQLQRARTEAESASKAKSQFLANMSHELRTPLNSVIGFSEILSDQTFGELNERQKKYVDNILGSGRHLLELINDILDLAKIEAGRLQLDPTWVDIEEALAGASNIISSIARKKGVDLSVSVSEQIPPIMVDASKLKQILYNLLSNAVKFTPQGGKVSVEGALLEWPPANEAELHADFPPLDPGRYLLVAVADTGIGIALKDQERLFREFEQLDSDYGRKQEGTGLGLTLTRRLVDLHGGKVWVESEGRPGSGSIFRFVIPFLESKREVPQAKLPDRDDLPAVLVIEDDPHANGLLDQYLSAAGYAVAHAHNGEQGLELARKLSPSAITLDILLPDQIGWEVLAKLKSDRRTQEIPVVIVSITEDRELGFSLGAVEYFVKPVNRERLVQAVRKAAAVSGDEIQSILVVDDEAETVEMLGAVLGEAGFTVFKALGGKEAIKLANRHVPDLITLDLLMPEVNGFEVVRRLRADPRTREIPILVHTSKELSVEEHGELIAHVQGITRKDGMRAFLEELERLTRRPLLLRANDK